MTALEERETRPIQTCYEKRGDRWVVVGYRRKPAVVEVTARPDSTTVGRAPEPAAGDTDGGNQP